MGQARLTRIDAVAEMAAAVDAFRSEATAALENLDMEIRRALEWIHHDRHDHWNHAGPPRLGTDHRGPHAASAGDDGPPYRQS